MHPEPARLAASPEDYQRLNIERRHIHNGRTDNASMPAHRSLSGGTSTPTWTTAPSSPSSSARRTLRGPTSRLSR